jgi:drug/metabolite transporter (DMT)-like permease
MENWVWIPISIGAALMQAVRTAGQKQLTADVTVMAASYVRFLFGLPLAVFYLWLLLIWFETALTPPPLGFYFFCLACAIAQIAGTVLLVRLFSYRNFAVGTTYARTEALLTALIGTVLFAEIIGWAGWIAIAISVGGVILVTLARTGIAGESLLIRLADRPAWIGIASGAGFAFASLTLRQASLSLTTAHWLVAAAMTLVTVLFMQTAIMSAYMIARERRQYAIIARKWKAAGFVGITSMLGSVGWFTAMTIERAAYVKALGQIEFIFTLAVSILYFRERSSPKELVGMSLVAGGIVVLLIYG